MLELTEETQGKEAIIQKATNLRSITLATKAFGRGMDFTCYE